MSQPEHFEMLILGSGEGGKYLACCLAKRRRKSATNGVSYLRPTHFDEPAEVSRQSLPEKTMFA
jgi:hypothetical protein